MNKIIYTILGLSLLASCQDNDRPLTSIDSETKISKESLLRYAILISLLIAFLLLLSSCEQQDNNGYPKSIEFHSNGGTEMISGDASFAYILILDGSDEHPSNTEDATITVSYDWLQVESLQGSKSLTITAQPNRTGHQRKLKVFGYFGNEYAVINIIQKA